MIIFDFLSANWDWLLAIVVIVVGVILRLRSLWKGNVIEWLVAICAAFTAVVQATLNLDTYTTPSWDNSRRCLNT